MNYITKRIKCLLISIAFLFLTFPFALQSQNLNCSNKSFKAEDIICSDDELLKLNSELEIIYDTLQKHSLNREKIVNESFIELKWRNENCKTKNCVKNWYESRKNQITAELKNINLQHSEEKPPSKEQKTNVSDTYILFFLIVFASIFYLIFHSIWSSFAKRCPKCKKWSAREIKLREVLSKYQTTRTKTYNETVKNKRGEVIRTHSRQKPVRVCVEECLYHYKCKYCYYQWKEKKELV